MLPGHWLRGLSRSSGNRCGRAGRKPLRRCGTKICAGARGKPAAEVRNGNRCRRAGQTCCGGAGGNLCGSMGRKLVRRGSRSRCVLKINAIKTDGGMMRKLRRWIQSKLHGYDLPELVKPKPLAIKPTDKICILAPHADDETIGCGGLLALYGPQCDVILLTDGAKGGDRSKPDEVRRVREAEFEEVMQFFDVRFYQFMRAEDGNLIEAYRLFQKLDLSGYDYVLMPHGLDSHKDHVVVSAFFRRLRRENSAVKAVPVYYEVWGAMAMPTHYLDISAAAEKKREAMGFYRSQGNIDYAGRILGLNHYRGIRHNVAYEEDYTVGE